MSIPSNPSTICCAIVLLTSMGANAQSALDKRNAGEPQATLLSVSSDQLIVQKVVTAIALADIKSITPLLTPQMSSVLTQDVATSLKDNLFTPRGRIRLISIRSRETQGTLTKLTFTVDLEEGSLSGELVENAQQKIARLVMLPIPSTLYDSYVMKAPVRLPFNGTWYVASGGSDPTKNSHTGNRAQNFACDYVIVKNGKTHIRDGNHNADYFAYQQPVLSPVDGTVVVVVDGVPENEPGRMNPYYAFGNSIVIKDASNEYAVIGHFKPNSFRIKVGQHIAMSQVVGLCGNSGNSSEPHIHFHMQNKMNVADADGLPITFRNFSQDGKDIVSGHIDGHTTVGNRP